MRTLKITNDNKSTVIRAIGEMLTKEDFSEAHEISVRPHKRKRSLEQNARLHKIIGECAKESGYSILEMKMEFKKHLLTPIAWFDYEGRKCPLYQSTADMNTQELTEFMNGVENLAAQWYSVTLPYQEAV